MGGYSTMTQQPEEIPAEYGATRRRQSGLYSNMLGLEMGAGGGGATDTARETDDTTGRTGGPMPDRAKTNGSAGTGQGVDYGSGARAHLSELIKQRDASMAPQPQPSGKQRLIQMLPEIAGVAAAAFSGQRGATQGAAQGIERGVARRNQVTDIHEREQYERQNKLIEDVNQQQRLMDQEEMERQRMATQEDLATKRMTLQEKMQSERQQSMLDQIAARGGEARKTEDEKEQNRENLEDQKQVGRMALAKSNQDARAAIARVRAAVAANKAKAIPGPVAKSFDDFETSQSRYDVMMNSYNEASRDPGNQQAMLNLLANHLGMTMGLQKGARLNQAIIDEAKRSGYLDERVEAHFGPDGYMTGVVLTPRQMSQMVELAKGRLSEDSRKVMDMETYFNTQGGMRPTPNFNPQQPNANAKTPPTPRPGFKIQQNKRTGEYREVPVAPAQ
jgi:hypothetical protein